MYNNTASTASEIKIENAIAGYNAALQIKTTVSEWDIGSNILAAAGSFEVYERTGGSAGNRLTILSGGKVGIGTTAPTAMLDVRRGDTSGKVAEFHQSAGYGIDIGSSQADAYISSGYVQNLIIKTNPGSGQVERIRIDKDGKVGIGVTAPVAKLHIDDSATGDNKGLYIQNTHNVDGDSAAIRFGFAGNDNANKGGIFFKRTANYGRGSLIFATENTQTNDNVDASDAKLTISADGKVGIGIASPGSILEVRGATETIPNLGTYGTFFNLRRTDGHIGLSIGIDSSTNNFWFQGQNSTSPIAQDLILNPKGGSIGIGEATTPDSTLQVIGPNAVGKFFQAQNQGASGVEFKRVNAGSAPYNHYLFHNGYVGIGTTSPASISASTTALHVYGTNAELKAETNNSGGWAFTHYKSPQGSWTVGMGDSDKFRITNSTSLTTSSRFVIDTTGNVGIGTDNPTFAAVSGNTVKGLNIQNVGQDTQASLRLTGHNASGNPGVATYTELLHAGANLRFDINHNGTVRFSIAPAGAITFNSAFTFPTADGSAGQVLQTNGSGTVTWASVTGGGGVSGSGTDNYIPRWNGTTALENSIIQDNGTTVTVGGALKVVDATVSYNSGQNRLEVDKDLKLERTTGTSIYMRRTTADTVSLLGKIEFGNNNIDSNVAIISAYQGGATDAGELRFETEATGGSIATRMIIKSDGKVGIGTNAPTGVGGRLLHIHGSSSTAAELKVQANYSAGLYIENGDGRARFYSSHGSHASYGGFIFEIGSQSAKAGTPVMRILSNGKVGIGTTAPSAPLQIYGSDNQLLKVTSTDAYAEICISDNTTTSTTSSAIGVHGNRLYLYTGGGQRLSVLGDGKVGIGTTAPAQKLHVLGDAIKFERTDNAVALQLYNNNASPADGASLGYLQFMGKDNDGTANMVYSEVRGGVHSNTNSAVSGFLSFLTTNNGTSVTEQMRIQPDGKVGIGTAAPGAKLHVYGGNIRISSTNDKPQLEFFETAAARWVIGHSTAPNNYFAISEGSDVAVSERLVIAPSTGSVGIGTTAPGAKLNVAGGAIRVDNTASTVVRLHLNNSGTNDYASIYADTAAAYKNLILNPSGGKVGIGTTSPEVPLVVAGAAGNQAIFRTNEATASQRAGGGFSSLGSSTAANRYARIFLDADGANFGGTDYFAIEKFGNSGEVKFLQYSNSNMSFWVNTTTQAMTIKNDGKVGIGTASPDQIFQVRVAANQNLRVRADSTAVQINARNDANSADVPFYLRGSVFNFQVGSVGIGTTAPSELLEVKGSGANIRISSDANTYLSLDSTQTNGDEWQIFNAVSGTTSGLQFKDVDTSKLVMLLQEDGNVGIGSASPAAPLDVPRASDYKVIKLGDDITSHYVMTGNSDHTLTLTCGSYYQAEIIVTAHQTNGGTYNNLYIRGIWSNNHTSHHWDEIETVGSLTNSTFTITNGQNGATAASGEWKIVHDYVSGTFVKFTVRITDFYGTHAYTIS